MRRGDAQDSERYDEQQTYGGVHETTEMPEHRAEASSSAFDLPSPPLDDDDDNQELLGPGYPSSAVDAETVEFGREGGAAAQGDETMELQRPGSKETIDVWLRTHYFKTKKKNEFYSITFYPITVYHIFNCIIGR